MDMSKYAGSESKYLKATDLGGKRPNVEIESVELVEFENDGKREVKPAIKLKGKEKALVLNASNTEEIMRVFGSDSDDWLGKSIQLSSKYYKAFDREGIVVTAIDTDGLDDDMPF